jgi:peptidoglycan/LPS O-acetylase OafA/YrhL
MQKNTVTSVSFADTKPHYELLDGLRGIAAILVLFYHIFEGLAFAEYKNEAGSGLITTLNHGHIAVDFFFILSGFVISYAYDDRWSKMSTWQFLKRRLVRLHPMLVMGAVIGALAFAFVGFEKWDGTTAPTGWVMAAMLLTMFMVPAAPGASYEVRGNGEMFPLNGPGWSLFFEYVGNILYALFIRRLSTKVLALLAVVLGAVHCWYFVGGESGGDAVAVGWTLGDAGFWGGMLRMMFPFTMGMLLARTFTPHKVKGAFWICSLVLVVLFAMPHIESEGNINLNALYEVLCIAVIFPLLVRFAACGECRGVAGRACRVLGDISYPLYIVHYPIMYIFYAWLIEKKVYTLNECLGVAALVVVSSIVLALLCRKLYDEPVRRWLTRKLK